MYVCIFIDHIFRYKSIQITNNNANEQKCLCIFYRTTSCPYLTLGMLGIYPCLNEDCASFGICFPSTIIEIVLFLHFLNNHSVAAQRKAHFFLSIYHFLGGGGGYPHKSIIWE